MIKIYPSLMAANLINLGHDIKLLEPHCDGFHIDVMDFHFVPNLTFGPDMVNAIRHASKKPLWVHLMVDEPARYIPRLQLRQGDILSIHYEAIKPELVAQTLKLVKDRTWQVSLALKPSTPLSVVTPFIPVLDQILLMSVEPGFSGQEFVASTQERLTELNKLKAETNARFVIGMDGGINETNIAQLAKAGVQDMGIGSAIFGSEKPIEQIKKLQEKAD